MPKKYLYLIIAVLFVLLAVALLAPRKDKRETPSSEAPSSRENILEETGKMQDSRSEDWWLNSGGIMALEKDFFATNFGRLPENSSWRELYSKTNPIDTDDGYYPQNIFRIVSRKKWENFSQSVYFYINTTNLSGSENRNESNGVLLFNRYQDGDNLYYAGLRVDGYAVIKKKIGGKYYTVADKKVFGKNESYDKEFHPNLLPEKQWVGIRSELKNIGEEVSIKLYADEGENGDWNLILETTDSENKYGESPFREEGYAGIRTDFMDVKFQGYKILDKS